MIFIIISSTSIKIINSFVINIYSYSYFLTFLLIYLNFLLTHYLYLYLAVQYHISLWDPLCRLHSLCSKAYPYSFSFSSLLMIIPVFFFISPEFFKVPDFLFIAPKISYCFSRFSILFDAHSKPLLLHKMFHS